MNINVDYLWTSASREQSCSMRKNNTCINPFSHRHHCLCLRLLRLRLLLCADRGSCAGLVCALGALGVVWEIHWLGRGKCMRAHDSVRWRWRRPCTMRRSYYGLHIASIEDICAKYMGTFTTGSHLIWLQGSCIFPPNCSDNSRVTESHRHLLGWNALEFQKMMFPPSTRSGKVTSSSLLNWMKGQILNSSVSRPLRSMTLRQACTNCHTFSLGNMAEGSWYEYETPINSAFDHDYFEQVRYLCPSFMIVIWRGQVIQANNEFFELGVLSPSLEGDHYNIQLRNI